MKLLKLALATGVAFSGAAFAAAPAAKPKVDPTYIPYEQVGTLVKIPNGQTIHVKCMGAGSPTVLLTAGAGGWAADWRKVQPQMARTTRVCAWDRPGFGFSSGTAQPQTTANRTADLEAALKLARIRGPFVVVGHSLGSYESLVFTDRNPRSVVGMVLVDPSVPDQFTRFRKVAPAFAAFMEKGISAKTDYFSRCIAGLESGALKVGGKDPEGCLNYSPEAPHRLTKKLRTLDTNPNRFIAGRSMLQNFRDDATAMVNPKRNFGDMPLLVLTAMKTRPLPKDTPANVVDQLAAQQAEWVRAHDDLAALSSRGVNRRIASSTHYIQYDQPQVVIDAANEVVTAARNGAGSTKGGTH